MTWVAVAIAGAAVVGAVGANMAANKQAGGLQSAAQTQQNMFNTVVGQEQPFVQSGYTATNSLNSLLNPSDAGQLQKYISTLPGYQFQLQTGGQALTNSMTPASGALSGQTLKSLMGFNQGLAGTYYNNYVQQLLGMSQIGQSAASNMGSAGVSLGTGVAQAQAGAGAAQGAGIMGSANSLSQIPYMMMMQDYMNPQSPAVNTTPGTVSGNIPGGTTLGYQPIGGT